MLPCEISGATIGLNLAGSRFEGTDPNLALYFAPGDGALGTGDYAAGDRVTGFDAHAGGGDPLQFETQLDVTAGVRSVVAAGAGFATFVVRPNPAHSTDQGAFLYSSNEIGSLTDQFFPARLWIRLGGECPVAIDVKPGDGQNHVPWFSHGHLSVAVLSGDGLSATDVDAGSARFGANGTEAAAVRSRLHDVDGDGADDLVLSFRIPDAHLACGDSQVAVTARTTAGRRLRGEDSVRLARCR